MHVEASMHGHYCTLSYELLHLCLAIIVLATTFPTYLPHAYHIAFVYTLGVCLLRDDT
jgi:hypothetical protein